MKKHRLFLFAYFLLAYGLLTAQNYQIGAPDDDAEESAGFTVVSLNSPVIDLTSDPGDPKFRKQIVGLRFNNIQLQKGTSLSNCYLQFRVAQASSAVTYLSIRGEKTGNAAPFQAVNRNLSMRPKTIAKIIWNNVEAWTQDGTTMKCPDLSQVLTEIINQPEWQPGNSIALYIEGNGDRHALAFESGQGNAVQLVLNGGAIAVSAAKSTASSASVNAPIKPETQQATPVAPGNKPQIASQSATPVQGSIKSGSSLEETINSTQAPIKVGLDSQIEVTIPQGVAPDGTKLTINKVSKVYNYDEIKIIDAFDVTLSCGKTFQKPLEMKLYIDKSKITGTFNKENIVPAFYNDSTNQWVRYKDYTIDEQAACISFKTDHLTTVSYFEFLTTGFYTEKFEAENCIIYYVGGGPQKPMENDLYNKAKQESWYAPLGDKNHRIPYLIQDIGHWFTVVKNVFQQPPYSFKVPSGKLNVYVKPLGDAAGRYGTVAGCLYIDIDQKAPVSAVNPSEYLKSTVAHEYMHAIQDEYYVMNKGKMGQWWLESLATQADRMAYGKLDYSESEMWSNYQLGGTGKQNSQLLEYAIAHEWDGELKSPHFYGPGIFLHYLAYYRNGDKLNLAQLMKDGSSNTDFSYFRTVLDNYLKQNLNTSIGQEFENFVKWAYLNEESKIKLNISRMVDVNNIGLDVNEEFKSTKLGANLPRLSAKIIRLRIYPKTIEAVLEREVESLSPGVKLFLCDTKTDGKPVIIKELKVRPKDTQGMIITETTRLGQKNPYNDLIVINPTNDWGFFSLNVKKQ